MPPVGAEDFVLCQRVEPRHHHAAGDRFIRGHGFHVGEDGRGHAGGERGEQRLLVGKMQIDRSLGDAGAGGHVLDARRGKATLGKEREGCREDLGPAFFRVSPSAGILVHVVAIH
ncbi:hypothetical protein D3C87_1909000 [compost metagenome]